MGLRTTNAIRNVKLSQKPWKRKHIERTWIPLVWDGGTKLMIFQNAWDRAVKFGEEKAVTFRLWTLL